MTKRHPLHSICPYLAMFPREFVSEQLRQYTVPGDLVFDPFCGRGTTVLESLLQDRDAAGADVNAVAVCLSAAKARTPDFEEVLARIDALEQEYAPDLVRETPLTPFFEHCYEKRTLAEMLFVRQTLAWRNDPVDGFLAAVMLGILHGESHRTSRCLSNRMPRTISTKPGYSIRWWRERGLAPPRRKVFKTLRSAVRFRYRVPPARRQGTVRNCDARRASRRFPELSGRVKLVVTSPPYLDTTDYVEDQWLRLWFLGGPPFPERRKNPDDRHRRAARYWEFLDDSWKGLAPLMAEESTIVIRIGGARLRRKQLFHGLTRGLQRAFAERRIKPRDEGSTTSIRPRETAAFRRGARPRRVEHDFVYRVLPASGLV